MFLFVHSHGVLASGDHNLTDSCFCFCHSCSPFALPFLVWSSGVRGIASTFCTAANARVRRHATVIWSIAELDYCARKVVTGEGDGEWDECQLRRLSGPNQLRIALSPNGKKRRLVCVTKGKMPDRKSTRLNSSHANT